jgi:phospholipase/carboxylesterase
MRPTKIGKWDAVVTGEVNTPTLVFFHGYGADMRDLAPLAHEMSLPFKARWVFPNGPLKVPIGPHMSGRAWAYIDMESIQEAMMRGEHRDLSGPAPEGFEEALMGANEFIKALGVPADQLILGGFSQGSMLATALAMTMDEAPAGLVIWSGNLVDKKRLEEWIPRRKGLKFIQTHGMQDPILGYEGAKSLFHTLKNAGLEGELLTFRGGHEIPMQALRKTADFLKAVLHTEP